MTDPSHAELERRILAGLSLGSTYAEASAALSELCRRLGEAEADRERLDAILHHAHEIVCRIPGGIWCVDTREDADDVIRAYARKEPRDAED